MAGRADSEGSAGTLLHQARANCEETRMEKQNLSTDPQSVGKIPLSHTGASKFGGSLLEW